MSILPKNFIEATVVIGVTNSANNVSWVATGFLVGRYEGLDAHNQKIYTTYLITNKHVVQNQSALHLQFNSNTGTSQNLTYLYRNNIRLYSEHPDPQIDVVAQMIDANVAIGQGAIVTFFMLDNQSLNKLSMKNTGVDEGALVYNIGFPVSLGGDLVNSINKAPVCRLGCISRIEHLYHNPNSKFYIIDAPAYPGNSGGPVINRPEIISIQNTPSNNTPNLIGIVSAYIPYTEDLISAQTKKTRMTSEENSGLTVVFPVDYIIETVEIERTRATGLQPTQKLPGVI